MVILIDYGMCEFAGGFSIGQEEVIKHVLLCLSFIEVGEPFGQPSP